MTNLSSSICYRLREERRKAKLSQGEVSAEVGCKQSALSMFEQGDGTKLNEEVVRRLAKKFNVDIDEKKDESSSGAAEVRALPSVASISPSLQNRGYCPNPHCPTNHAYEVDGRVLLRPERTEADPVNGRYCAFCGEVLEKKCPNCGAHVHDGAICSYCGEPYVANLP